MEEKKVLVREANNWLRGFGMWSSLPYNQIQRIKLIGLERSFRDEEAKEVNQRVQ